MNYKIIKMIDKPDQIFDEIVYESQGGLLLNKTVLILKKDGSAMLSEENGRESKESVGKIPIFNFESLSNFIVSQCFNDFKEVYKHSASDVPKHILTVKYNGHSKSVLSYGSEHNPIGLWALRLVIMELESQINWEVIKNESKQIKRLNK